MKKTYKVLIMGLIIVVILISISLIGYSYWWLPRHPKKISDYNLIYCYGRPSDIDDIKVVNGEVVMSMDSKYGKVITLEETISDLEERGYMSWTLFDETGKSSKFDMTPDEVNQYQLITTETSPDGAKIVKEKSTQTQLDGAVDVYVSRGSSKEHVATEYTKYDYGPRFKLIGWVKK